MEKDLLHLITKRDETQISDEQWARSAELALAKSGLPEAEFCHAYSHLVAREFVMGELSYAEGDLAMNRLSTLSREPLSGFSLKIYLAFDAGEYQRPKDATTIIPWLNYTIPLIIEALKYLENPASHEPN
ncbi:hypothetical protein M2262_004643 [Pseudomonas sp. BIGb0408]|uniref:Uncharacterized protein n=1 Tax=Phytopseudomonas flavescens TaxID=29435 RepID=A0A7Z0BTC7_9GAMM|nr:MULTISPECIES: hypothetical protein [Pseudomonas]MCW2294593.1 hypothetical protein [Pseudomonas sp. BIGb0408]NYH76133.1 hypothetical protein [Pseudomonas flavescens]